MNPMQIKSMQRFTNHVEYMNRLSNGDTINGDIIWSLYGEPFADGKQMFTGSNENIKWFHTSIHIVALVGRRGGIKLLDVKGFDKSHISKI